ncbi:hypothetical protein E2C01_097065 [Portunus trituberculatus]|uniref:Uncharacterized protein n=1 Tax=Portunus trituberculatus TaxID=210409 RepID=A0A5B7JZG6_PORTR|nr:hypothetical protein [Portunus trituberculatus]
MAVLQGTAVKATPGGHNRRANKPSKHLRINRIAHLDDMTFAAIWSEERHCSVKDWVRKRKRKEQEMVLVVQFS